MLRDYENLPFACVFKHCGLKANDFKPFLSAVRGAHTCEDGVQRVRSIVQSYFCHLIGLERLNTHICMCQNACLCKYPLKHNIGLK